MGRVVKIMTPTPWSLTSFCGCRIAPGAFFGRLRAFERLSGVLKEEWLCQWGKNGRHNRGFRFLIEVLL